MSCKQLYSGFNSNARVSIFLYSPFIRFNPQIVIWYNCVSSAADVWPERKKKVWRSCSSTQKWKSPCFWVGGKRSQVCCWTHWSSAHLKREKKRTAATLSRVSQAWRKDVCHTGWSGQEIIICSALEEGEPEAKSIRGNWAEDIRLFLWNLADNHWGGDEFPAWRARVWVQPRCPERTW